MSPTASRRVLLAASGAGWETALVREIEAAHGLVLARRCVDVAELVALAQAGAGEVGVVDLALPGLDLESVEALGAAGVLVVGVGPDEVAAALGIGVVATERTVVAVVEASRTPDPTPTPDPADPSAPRGRVVAVWGAGGGPGRSTLALALADRWSSSGRSTVLLDADPHGGAQAQLVGLLDEVSGLMAACRAANRGDVQEVDQHLQRIRTGLVVLTGVPRPDMWVHVRRAAAERVLEHLVDGHDLVVLDLGPGLPDDATGAALLEAADVVVAVGRADPVGLTRLVRGLHQLAEAGVADPLVVLNRVRPSMGWSADQLTATVERLAGRRPVAQLPDDPATIDAALLRGRTPREVSAGSPYVRAVAALSDVVDGAVDHHGRW